MCRWGRGLQVKEKGRYGGVCVCGRGGGAKGGREAHGGWCWQVRDLQGGEKELEQGVQSLQGT